VSDRARLEAKYAAHHAQRGRYGFSYRVEERGPALAAWVARGRRVLDLGCRDGSLTQYYAAGNTVTGVDIDRAALARARETLGIETVWLNLNSEPFPFPPGTFDVVVAGEILEHVVAPEDVAAEARRVLVPGGQFVGSVPNSFHWRSRLAFLAGRSDEDPTHLHLFSLEKVRPLLSGFAWTEIVPLGSVGGRWMPQVPGPLAGRVVRRWPTLFASDFLFHARREPVEGQEAR
jgi:SAM-dependent methyltransferase